MRQEPPSTHTHTRTYIYINKLCPLSVGTARIATHTLKTQTQFVLIVLEQRTQKKPSLSLCLQLNDPSSCSVNERFFLHRGLMLLLLPHIHSQSALSHEYHCCFPAFCCTFSPYSNVPPQGDSGLQGSEINAAVCKKW